MGLRMESVRVILAGEVERESLAEHARTSRYLIIAGITAANFVGAAIVVVLLGLVLPLPKDAADGGTFGLNTDTLFVVGGYVVAAILAGTVVGLRRARPVIDFFRADRSPTEADRRAVLRLPLVLLQVQGALWLVAVVLFGGTALRTSGLYGFEVAITTALGGIATSSFAYLITQRLLRSGIAIVLAENPPRRREVPGVRVRAIHGWTLGAVPTGGLIALTATAPEADVTVGELVRSAAVLAAVSLVTGLLATLLVSGSVSEPLQGLRDAFGSIERGDYDVSVPVYDATEVGFAAASFNRMAAGLQERERLRDLFGRQVGTDVARQALADGVSLGGEERDAAALFVDVIGSTSFAADRPPTEVVDALNSFFEAVVDATQEHGGLVNKFIGDAALCIFGAPLAQDDPAGAALAAARDMADRLRGGTLDAGIGVAVGTVVAGNVGTAERYEYTVIGDPVNEAARITELAKDRAGRVLASGAAVDAAAPEEAKHWTRVDEVHLRGRSRATELAEPSSGG